MDPRLKKVVAEVKRYAGNPGTDPGVALQLELLRSGHQDEFEEEQVLEAARDVGVPEESLSDWAEDFASFL